MDLGTIPYLVEKPGARRPIFYWQPGKALRDAGFLPERLPADRAAAEARARELNAGVAAWRTGLARVPGPGNGTLGALIAAYRASEEFKALRASTRRGYRQCLDRLDDWGGDLPTAAIDTVHLKKRLYFHMRRKTPAFAAAVIRVARLLFEWGISENLCAANPARAVAIAATRQPPVIWPGAAVRHFTACADALGRWSVGTAVTLNEWTGQRQGDVLAFPRARYRAGSGIVTQSKTGATVMLPIGMVPHLAARIDDELAREAARRAKKNAGRVAGLEEARPPLALIVSEETGRAYRGDDFRHQMRWIQLAAAGDAGLDHMQGLAEAARLAPAANTDAGRARVKRLDGEIAALARDIEILRAAGLEPRNDFTIDEGLRQDGATVALLDLDFMHTRHTAVTRLAVAGATAPEIAAITGHSLTTVEKILDLYLVRNSELARNAFAKRIAHEKEPG